MVATCCRQDEVAKDAALAWLACFPGVGIKITLCVATVYVMGRLIQDCTCNFYRAGIHYMQTTPNAYV
jgi:hypothetical protein